MHMHPCRRSEDTEDAKNVEVLACFSSPRRYKTRAGDAPMQSLQLMREVSQLQGGSPRRLTCMRLACMHACMHAPCMQVTELQGGIPRRLLEGRILTA